MASTRDFLDFIIDQIDNKNLVKWRKMFGEYAIYYDNKVIGLITDNQFYLKNTKVGREFIAKELGEENLKLASPFPKAKDWILLDEEIENKELLNELIEIIRSEL